MSNISPGLLMRAMVGLLRPLARLFLRNGLRLKEISECLKRAYVESALADLESAGHKVTTSRLALITGVHRKDIERILSSEPDYQRSGALLTKIVGQWQSDKRFSTKDGRARTLSGSNGNDEFYQLVRTVSRELNPATVMFELERSGIIERSARGVRLLKTSYSPPQDLENVANIIGQDIDDLLESVGENLARKKAVPNLHARTTFDNVRPKDLKDLRRWLVLEGHSLHGRVRERLAKLDQDTNPDPNFKGRGVRVMLGTFSRIDED